MSQNTYDPNSPQQMAHDGVFSPGREQNDTNATPPRQRRRWLWILFSVFGLGTLGLITCCGVGSFYFSEISASLLEPARAELNELTQIQEECGNIEALSMNFAGTLKEAEIHRDFVILDAQTESGPQQFSIKMNPDGSVEQAYLIRKDGTRQELDFNSRVAVASSTGPKSQQGSNFPPASQEAQVLDATELELRKLESELELD